MAIWHYQKDGVSKGPFSDEQMKALCEAGVVNVETLVWQSSYKNWKPLADTDFPFKSSILPPPQSALRHEPAGAVPMIHAPIEPDSQAEDLSMWQYFTRCLTSKYATFKGRARRKEYWSYTLFNILGLIAVTAAGYLIDLAAGNLAEDVENPAAVVASIFLVIYLFGTIIPGIALMVRRVHDLGITGWLAILCFIPSIGWIVALVVALIPGQPVDNAYGASPKAA